MLPSTCMIFFWGKCTQLRRGWVVQWAPSEDSRRMVFFGLTGKKAKNVYLPIHEFLTFWMGSISRYIFFFDLRHFSVWKKLPKKNSAKRWDLMPDVHPMGSQSGKNHIRHIQVFHWENVEVIFCFYLENIRTVSYILGSWFFADFRGFKLMEIPT